MVRAVISVADADRSLLFYRDVLGLPAEPRGPGIVVLLLPDGVEIQLHRRPPTPSVAAIAVTLMQRRPGAASASTGLPSTLQRRGSTSTARMNVAVEGLE